VTTVSARPAYGWTFLVARGRHEGYQPLLVPDFLAESNEYGVLGELTGGDSIVRVRGLAGGDVALAQRNHRLTDADLGDSSGGPLTDEFGRPLELLYGFVVRAEGIGALEDADFAVARAEALRTYRRFLTDESGFELESSKPFALQSIPATAEPVPSALTSVPSLATTAEPAAVVARPIAARRIVLVALLVVVVSAAAWALLLRGRSGPVTDVEILGPSASTVDCDSPITVRATIKTNAKATVTYHWESTLSSESEPVAIDFPAAASKTVKTTVQPQASSGAPITFTQTLVVDDPNSTESSRDYKFTCR
jgi:hypothetical protein